MTVFIYGLYDPRTNELRYIGKAIDLKIRFDLHISETRCGRESHKNRWLAQLIAAGLLPIMRTLEVIENSNDQDWQERERWWIKAARETGDRLTNLDDGGRSGTKKCEETKNKISMSNLGKKMSPEAVAKMKATKAARLTPEVRERIAAGQRGKKQSPELVAKRCAALKGRMVSEETRRKISEANKISRERYLALHPPKCRQPKPPRMPRVFSNETRQRMSEAAKLRAQTPEGIAHQKNLIAARAQRKALQESSTQAN